MNHFPQVGQLLSFFYLKDFQSFLSILSLEKSYEVAAVLVSYQS